MIRRILLFIFYFQNLLYSIPILAQVPVCIDWSVAATLPPVDSFAVNPGVAGAFAGVHHDALLIAGGANFPNGKPWNGGKKVYWDAVYVLQKSKAGNYQWNSADVFKLKQRVAYGASVTAASGVVCIGGENEKGFLKEVFLLQWNMSEKEIAIKGLPPLPFALTNLFATAIGSTIYVAGGESSLGISDKFIFLDLDNVAVGWKELPHAPTAFTHAVMITQSNGHHECIYVIGGRCKGANGISDFYRSVFEFDPVRNEWTEKASLPYAISAGTGVAIRGNEMLIFGGDTGETFRKTEELIAMISAEKDTARQQALIKRKNNLQETHPGFNQNVLLYNTVKNSWEIIGKMPYKTPVTTTAVTWVDQFFIPSGEIQAGIRTPKILSGKLKFSKP